MSDLQDAFREAVSREFAAVPEEDELTWEFSPRFQRKMRRILRAQANGYWQLVNTAAKRAACAAAIIILLLTTAMAIRPVRERVIRFFVEIYEEFCEITFGEEEQGDINLVVEPITRYTLTRVPEIFWTPEVVESDSMILSTWENADGEKIILKQELGSQSVTIDNRYTSAENIVYGELIIVHYSSNGTDVYLWEQNEYTFMMSVYGGYAIEEHLVWIASLDMVSRP